MGLTYTLGAWVSFLPFVKSYSSYGQKGFSRFFRSIHNRPETVPRVWSKGVQWFKRIPTTTYASTLSSRFRFNSCIPMLTNEKSPLWSQESGLYCIDFGKRCHIGHWQEYVGKRRYIYIPSRFVRITNYLSRNVHWREWPQRDAHFSPLGQLLCSHRCCWQILNSFERKESFQLNWKKLPL